MYTVKKNVTIALYVTIKRFWYTLKKKMSQYEEYVPVLVADQPVAQD